MNRTIFFICLLTGVFLEAQSNFYQATLTDNNNDSKVIFLKKRSEVTQKHNEITIYLSEDYKDNKVITAKDFTRLTTPDGSLEIVSIPTNCNGSKECDYQILRKLVSGDHSLFVYMSEIGAAKYYDYYNGVYTELYRKSDTKNDQMGYQKYLSINFNPNGLTVNDYAFDYKRDDLIGYYMANNNGNAAILQQEPTVKTLELSANVGINHNSLSLKSPDISDNVTSGSNLKASLQLLINFDRIRNKHSGLLSVNYYTTSDMEGNGVLFPQSNINRDQLSSSASLSLIGIQVGYQHHMHIDNLRVSPFASFEPLFYNGTQNLTAIDSDNQEFYNTDTFLNTPTAFNLGLQVTLNQRYYASLKYTLTQEIRSLQPMGEIIYNINGSMRSFSFSLGYRFL